MGLISVLRNARKFSKTRGALLQNFRILVSEEDAEIIISINNDRPHLNEHELAIAFLSHSCSRIDPESKKAEDSAKRWLHVANMALENGWVNSEIVAELDENIKKHFGNYN